MSGKKAKRRMLESARAKIKRAKKHLAEVEGLIKAFNDTNPYALGRKADEEAGERHTTIHHRGDIPDDIPLAIGDCVHNCRVALDHLAWDLVRKGGTHDPERSKPRFPIHGAADDFSRNLAGDVQGAPPAALRLIERLKPYVGGNECFAILSRLDNCDKHRFVVVVRPAVESIDVDFGPQLRKLWGDRFADISPPVLKFKPNNPGADHGTEIFTSRTEDAFDENLTFHIHIAFDEAGVPKGESVTIVLHQLIDFTERVVDIFDRAIFPK